MKKREDTILHILLLIIDMIGSLFAVIIAFAIRYKLFLGINNSGDSWWIMAIVLLSTIVISIFVSPVNKYTTRGTFAELTDVLVRQILATIGVVVILYLAHTAEILSRLVFGYYIVSSILIIWALRLLLKKYLLKVYKKQKTAIQLIVVSTKDRIEKVANKIEESNEWQRVISQKIAIEDDDFDKAVDYAVHHEVDEAFISIAEIKNKEAYQGFIAKLIGMGIKVDIDINQFEMDIPGRKFLDEVGQFATVSAARNALSISQQFVKRFMDILGGAIGCVLFLIVLIILAPIIKIDSKGSVIFVQKRVGKNGRMFDFYKFRSMYKDADSRKKELETQNEVHGLMFKIEDDPRITKVGKFLRKTSLDELPQFWNVLKGDMSLVGTRPPTVDEYERYEPWHKSRLSMKPGITGLWQVSGRSDIKDFDEVVKLDMQYIDNWSIGEDIKILLKTIGVVFSGKGSK